MKYQLARSLATLYKFTKSYDEVMNAPYVPLMLITYLAHEDEMNTPTSIERKVEQAGGWQPFDAGLAKQLMHSMDNEGDE